MKRLDTLVNTGRHRIEMALGEGPPGHPGNERADALANQALTRRWGAERPLTWLYLATVPLLRQPDCGMVACLRLSLAADSDEAACADSRHPLSDLWLIGAFRPHGDGQATAQCFPRCTAFVKLA